MKFVRLTCTRSKVLRAAVPAFLSLFLLSVATIASARNAPTVATGTYSNPGLAYDNNTLTYSEGFADDINLDTEEVWSGFAAGSGTHLNITSSVSTVSTWSSVILKYSLDGGSTWVVVYHVINGSQRTKATDAISLPAGQDLRKVQVWGDANAHSGGTADHRVYEIWIQ